jgi:bZIP-type transcription factor MBZ1
MLTDTPAAAQPFSFDPTVDDFFNLDVLNSAPSAFTTTSSSQSSSSPRSPFSFSTPLTPPSFPPLTATGADDDFFAQFLDTDEFSKGPSLSSLSLPPYDIFGAGPTGASASGSSPESMDASTPMFAIDPQLVGTPATSHEHSDLDSDSDHDEPEPDPAPTKRSRRGAVASGGIKKSSAPSEKDLNTAK